ncbi:T-cell surface glycoprotein CD8 alpha chain [Pseudorasbora parva]|uniref:T-cell surface glycoprotein CD8 alpha chain n=1 Tax=Pseudorasbora parva TaxID=51549 RepID=UPI00351E572C
MYQMYIGFCVILCLFHGGSAHRPAYEDGEIVKVDCDPGQAGTLTFWFRVNKDGAEFLFTVKNKEIKAKTTEYDVNLNDKVSLTIKSFEKKTDSGIYACAAMNNNKLIFGKPTVITGKPDPTTQPPKIDTTTPKPSSMTTAKCIESSGKKEPKPRFNCETWILSSLASGCALLLISLIATILYCNRLRTRRCPHHYKRQPQTRPAGHAKLPNNHF